MEHYDAIVIGSGQAGTPLSMALAEAGRKTAVVESQHVGGTCINVAGCTPTKTHGVASARRSLTWLGAGPTTAFAAEPVPALTWGKFTSHKQAVVDNFRAVHSVDWKMPRMCRKLIFGERHFTGPNVVEVRLDFRRHSDIDR